MKWHYILAFISILEVTPCLSLSTINTCNIEVRLADNLHVGRKYRRNTVSSIFLQIEARTANLF